MTLFEHPLWPTLLSHLYLDTGGVINGPRQRTEVSKSAPAVLLGMVIECARCHAPIYPVRVTKRKLWTLNVSCPLKVNPDCARSPEARAVKAQVLAAMEHAPAPVGSLFE